MNRPAGTADYANKPSSASTPAQLGNAALLHTRKVALLCSRRCPGTVIVKTLDLALALRGRAVTVVGGFQSSTEKECLEILLRGAQPVIVCPARGVAGMRVPARKARARPRFRLLVCVRRTGRQAGMTCTAFHHGLPRLRFPANVL